MNKQELIEFVAQQTGETKRTVGNIINAVGDALTAGLQGSGEVQIPGIGKLVRTVRKERAARNPQTGDPVTIPAGFSVKFKAAKQLKDAMNPSELG